MKEWHTSYDIFRKFDCDFNIMGHLHQLMVDVQSYIALNKAGKMIERKRAHILAGSFLRTVVEGHRNYFEGKKGKLSDIGFIEIEFFRSRKNDKDFIDYRVIKHEFERI